jgi:hypothetical protein
MVPNPDAPKHTPEWAIDKWKRRPGKTTSTQTPRGLRHSQSRERTEELLERGEHRKSLTPIVGQAFCWSEVWFIFSAG